MNRKLYGGGNRIVRIWDTKAGGGWKCIACVIENFGK